MLAIPALTVSRCMYSCHSLIDAEAGDLILFEQCNARKTMWRIRMTLCLILHLSQLINPGKDKVWIYQARTRGLLTQTLTRSVRTSFHSPLCWRTTAENPSARPTLSLFIQVGSKKITFVLIDSAHGTCSVSLHNMVVCHIPKRESRSSNLICC